MATQVSVDVENLRSEVQLKYAEVAETPDKKFHFHTGRFLAERLGYPSDVLDKLPGECVESFAGVGNPFSLGELRPGENVVDVGSGAGFDCLVAAQKVGPDGSVIGVDMTPEMLSKARRNARAAGASNVAFRKGLVEKVPLPNVSTDVIISNGVINLVPDKQAVLKEIFRVLKPGGRMYLADIVVHKEVPLEAKQQVDFWTA